MQLTRNLVISVTEHVKIIIRIISENIPGHTRFLGIS